MFKTTLNGQLLQLGHALPDTKVCNALLKDKIETVLSTLDVDSGAPNMFKTTLNGELLQLGHALPDTKVCNALLKDENWAEELKTWDPIALAYHNISNNYITNDDDLQMATQGYRSKKPVCQFFQNRDG